MNITTAAADLAKNLITVCAQDASGRTVERRDLRREGFLPWLQRLPADCVVGMEACSASHYWAREMGRALDRRAAANAEQRMRFRGAAYIVARVRKAGTQQGRLWICSLSSDSHECRNEWNKRS